MRTKLNRRHIAIITGLSIITMAIVAGLIMGLIFSPIFEMSESELSKQLPQKKNDLLIGIFGWIVIFICDIIATWGLFNFYKKKNELKPLFMGLLRLIYSLILLFAITKLIFAYSSINESNFHPQLPYILIQKFQSIWQFGLILFGLHLLFLATLVCQKKSVLQIIAIFLFIAGIGYFSSNILDLFIDNYEKIRSKVESVFILPMVLSELGLAIWLLISGGGKLIQKEKQFASESY